MDIYGELADLEMNDDLIRKSDDDITFFKSVGTAYFDLVIGNGIYKKVTTLGIGKHVNV